MKGGTSLIALVLLSAHLSFAQVNVCDRLFDYSGGDEYLPFPLVVETLADGQKVQMQSLYVAKLGMSFDVSHLMGAEYYVEVKNDWDKQTGRGVLAFADNNFAGFVEYGGEQYLLDIGYAEFRGKREFFVRFDGQCYKAETERNRLR